MSIKEKIAKNRKAGWIATAILAVLMVIMLIAYIATDGTYGLELNDASNDTLIADVSANANE